MISRKLRGKYFRKLLDISKNSGTDPLKTASNGAIGDLNEK